MTSIFVFFILSGQNRSPFFLKFSNRNFIPRSFFILHSNREGKMHLWPTERIRDSFKHAYIKKLEFNFHRMKIQKHQQQQSSSKQNLLDKEQASAADGKTAENSNPVCFGRRVLDFCSEALLLLSCCYCCYCCGGDSSFPFSDRPSF